jgi:uroporphyrinogen-III decarboxylase
VDNKAAVLGFVGAPFTLASYVVEGGSSKHFSKIKRLAFSEPKVIYHLTLSLRHNKLVAMEIYDVLMFKNPAVQNLECFAIPDNSQ